MSVDDSLDMPGGAFVVLLEGIEECFVLVEEFAEMIEFLTIEVSAAGVCFEMGSDFFETIVEMISRILGSGVVTGLARVLRMEIVLMVMVGSV